LPRDRAVISKFFGANSWLRNVRVVLPEVGDIAPAVPAHDENLDVLVRSLLLAVVARNRVDEVFDLRLWLRNAVEDFLCGAVRRKRLEMIGEAARFVADDIPDPPKEAQ